MPWLTTTAPPVLVGPPFALAFLWLCAAVGRRLVRLLGVKGGHPAERALTMLGLGLGVLEFVPFALGAAGVLSVTTLRIAMAAVALLAVPDLYVVARAALASIAGYRRPERPFWPFACVAAALPAVLVSGLVALAPSFDTDGLSYHLGVPKRWLAQGSLVYLPTYVYSNTPMGIEMHFATGLAFGGDIAAKALHFALGVGGAVGLYFVGKYWRGKAVGVAAALLYLVGPAPVAPLIGWAYLEGAIGFAVIATTAAWLVWLRTRDTAWLRATFLLAGVSISFKITAVLLAGGLFALTLLVLAGEARERGVRFRPEAGVWLAPLTCTVPVLPWLARSALLTSNPFYPMFASIIPTREYSPRIAALFSAHNRYFVWGSTSSLDLRGRQLLLLGFAVALVLGAAIIFWRVRSWSGRGLTMVVLGVVLVQLAMVGPYVRYWVPMVSVLALPLLALAEPVLAGRWAGALLLVMTGFSLQRARSSLAKLDDDVGGAVRASLGLEPARDFLLRRLPLFPLYERVNREAPADAVVLLSYYCGGTFHLDRSTLCAEFMQDSLRFTDWEEFSADFSRLKVTHVIAPRRLATSAPPPSAPPPTPTDFLHMKEDELIGRVLQHRGKELASALDQGLYEIDEAAPAQASARH